MKYSLITNHNNLDEIIVITEDGGYAEMRDRGNITNEEEVSVIELCHDRIPLEGELHVDDIMDIMKFSYMYLDFSIIGNEDKAVSKALNWLVPEYNVTDLKRDDSIIEKLTLKGL